tara:strand:+ start:387 stop:1337 length:951 start_codon:yes stop_codon:yes gene_type:complete
MSNNKYLIVYNICEIGRRNCEWYIKCIDNLLRLNHKKFHVAVSGCRVSQQTKEELYNKFKDRVSFCYTENFLAVNVTFNLTVMRCIKVFGNFTGYIYFDSGVDIEDNYNLLNEIDERVQTERFSMITIQTDTDHGHHWFNPDHVNNPYIKNKDFIMPVGKCCNLHVSYFSDELRAAFSRPLPDIFRAFCTESVLSFLNASIKKQWVILKDIILTHDKETDGAVGSYDFVGPRQIPWNNLYGTSDMKTIVDDPEAKEVGLGYEEVAGILMHNPELYTSEGHCKNNTLKDYIKKKLFLSTDQLDYNHILYNFIPVKNA